MKYCSAFMLIMAPSHLAQDRTCNVEWNQSTSTLRDLDWKCTSDTAHWSQRPNVFPPPSTILPTPGADTHCGQHHQHAVASLQTHSD